MAEAKSDFQSGDRVLTLVFLAPPVIWFAHLSVAYSLVPTACSSGSRMILHVCTVAALVLLALAGTTSWRRLKHYGIGETDAGETQHLRRRFMAIVGTVFAIAFAMAVLANEIPITFLRDCA